MLIWAVGTLSAAHLQRNRVGMKRNNESRLTAVLQTASLTLITLVLATTTGAIGIGGCAKRNEGVNANGTLTQATSDDVASLTQHTQGIGQPSSNVGKLGRVEPTRASVEKDAKGLDIYTVTLFDLRMKELCMGHAGLEIRYAGPLNRGMFGQRVHDRIEDYLEWHIVGRAGLVVSRLSISLEKTGATLVTIGIEGRPIHVSVDYVSDPELSSLVDVDTPLSEISGLTVRQFLERLEDN